MSFLPAYGPTEGPLGFPMLDRQARQLDTLLKALPKAQEHASRKAVTAKAPTELYPGERSDVSWITTERVDRTQEVVLAKGMNDSLFAANPLVTLQHAYPMPAVGRFLWRKRVRDGDLVGIKAKNAVSRQAGFVGAGRPVAAGQGAITCLGRVAQREVDQFSAPEGTPRRCEVKKKSNFPPETQKRN